jgi:hypothetical protein
MANVIKHVFWATVCACDARCDVTPDIPDRMNCTIMVYMRRRWRRWLVTLPTPLGEVKKNGNM